MSPAIGVLARETPKPVVANAIPRPEFPQPQFARRDWKNLNGDWTFQFDDANAGLNNNWAAADKPLAKKIIVPFPFESRLSQINEQEFHPYLWYRKNFDRPAAWKDSRVLLHFGAVHYKSTIWVNGHQVGSHVGGNTPFYFEIASFLKASENVITVRAEDDPTDMYIPRGKQYWKPRPESIFYTRSSGIWQSVWLEATGHSYIDHVRIEAFPQNHNVQIQATVIRGQPDIEVFTTIQYHGKTVATVKSDVSEDGRANVLANLPQPEFWSPETPNLYTVTFEIRKKNGEPLDHVDSYFGFRTVTQHDGKVFLNGQPRILKFVLDQGYWPESLLSPPSDEAIQFDIRATKAMGFNGVRKHQKVEDPRFLYWADHMGLLVSSEMANAQSFDGVGVERFTTEWMAAVARDFNHPSIIIWAPINESWGVPHLTTNVREQDQLRATYALTHALDSTRLVVDNDGWEHTNLTDLIALHDYAKDGEALLARYKNVLHWPIAGDLIPNVARPTFIPGYHYNGSPLYLSEFGGIAFILPGMRVPAGSWGYDGIEPTAETALARFRSLFVALKQIPTFSGYVYTQLTDVEQEINGLMTYDRRPKFDVTAIKAINDSL